MFYNDHLMKPLNSIKKKEVALFHQRSDFKQVIATEDLKQFDIFNIQKGIFNRIENSNNLALEEFQVSLRLARNVSMFEAII